MSLFEMLLTLSEYFIANFFEGISNSFLQRIGIDNFDQVNSLKKGDMLAISFFLCQLSFFQNFKCQSINYSFIFVLDKRQAK